MSDQNIQCNHGNSITVDISDNHSIVGLTMNHSSGEQMHMSMSRQQLREMITQLSERLRNLEQ